MSGGGCRFMHDANRYAGGFGKRAAVLVLRHDSDRLAPEPFDLGVNLAERGADLAHLPHGFVTMQRLMHANAKRCRLAEQHVGQNRFIADRAATASVIPGRPFFICIGVSHTSRAPAANNLSLTAA